MTVCRISPDKDVREEARVLERLGFLYVGHTANGHLRFEHPGHGAHGRRANRRALARLMRLDVHALTALIAGQESVGRATHHHPSRRRPRKPRALRHLSIAPEAVAEPVVVVEAPAVFSPSDPISESRRAHWARLRSELDRQNLENRFPWRAAA